MISEKLLQPLLSVQNGKEFFPKFPSMPPSESPLPLCYPQCSNFVPPSPGICGACGEYIFERYYLLAADKCWHLDCLTCHVCHCKLEGEATCYVKDAFIFCKRDYFAQFAVCCGRCESPIRPKEMVLRAKRFTYHLSCFTCFVCNHQLNPGQYFAVNQAGSLFCQMHYEPLLYSSSTTVTLDVDQHSCTDRFEQAHENDRNLIVSTPSKSSRSKKKKNRDLQACMSDMMLAANGVDIISISGSSSSVHRAKRMRTSFKHHQLKAMKAYFALNHNPDAKDLKQLAQRTGLTKRVLQVWFQNARAKYRRAKSSEGGEGGDDDDETGRISSNGSGTGSISDVGSKALSPTEKSFDCSSPKLDRPVSKSLPERTADTFLVPYSQIFPEKEAVFRSCDDYDSKTPSFPHCLEHVLVGDSLRTYSPQIGGSSMSDTHDGTEPKSLADYFQNCG